eukprot:TRINITY_DN27371_c0_g1_i1.p1 TRINITY_DN27371_c0_g1~~TRINITY_DN27371_c0_g1_i1.p1  ORF type:complete len:459 (+),score=185.24 TRINITY_DN27371_c0_g1_i1:123-1499(+)
MALRSTNVQLKVGGMPLFWRKGNQTTTWGYRMKQHDVNFVKTKARQEAKAWTQLKEPKRNWRFEYFRHGDAANNAVKKMQWGSFSDKIPTSVYFQPGPIAGTDPSEHALLQRKIAPEFAGNYEAKPWVTPAVYPEGHALSRMPAPIRNIVAQAEHKKNFWSRPEWYSMAEGEVLTPFEVLELDVKRVGLWMKGGRHWNTMVLVMVSNGNGVAGLGVGEQKTYDDARNAAIKGAFGNLIAIDTSDKTVPYPVYHEFVRTEVQIMPGKTLKAAPVFADVLNSLGIQGGSVTVKKRFHKKYKRMMTLFAALRQMRSSKVIAQQRGMSVSTVKSPLFTYYEQVRRRRGMFEMTPVGAEGGTGFLPPNRVIDNRIPDHLKKKYFAGTSDESFGHVASSETFRLDAGTERYGRFNAPYVNLSVDQSDEIGQHKPSNPRDVDHKYIPPWTKGVQTTAREEWLAFA